MNKRITGYIVLVVSLLFFVAIDTGMLNLAPIYVWVSGLIAGLFLELPKKK